MVMVLWIIGELYCGLCVSYLNGTCCMLCNVSLRTYYMSLLHMLHGIALNHCFKQLYLHPNNDEQTQQNKQQQRRQIRRRLETRLPLRTRNPPLQRRRSLLRSMGQCRPRRSRQNDLGERIPLRRIVEGWEVARSWDCTACEWWRVGGSV